MNRIIRGQLVTLAGLLTAMVVTLAACGGGGSSTGGGASGSTVAGTVDNGSASFLPGGTGRSTFLAVADLLVDTARAAGVPGVNVELLDTTGAVVDTRTTDANGRFVFTGLAPGNYSLRLSQGGAALGQTPTIQVDSNTATSITLQLDGGVSSISVEAQGGGISGQAQGGMVADGSSDDDQDSVDDDSADDDSDDDESADDGDSTDDDDSNVDGNAAG